MLSQIEAPRTHAAIINTAAFSIPAGITATVTGTTITCSMPTPVTGVTVKGSTVTTTPGTYEITFTLVGDTFNQQWDAITVSTPIGPVFVQATSLTTATVNVANTLVIGDQHEIFPMTFNLTKAGPIDPTIVNDPPQALAPAALPGTRGTETSGGRTPA